MPDTALCHSSNKNSFETTPSITSHGNVSSAGIVRVANASAVVSARANAASQAAGRASSVHESKRAPAFQAVSMTAAHSSLPRANAAST